MSAVVVGPNDGGGGDVEKGNQSPMVVSVAWNVCDAAYFEQKEAKTGEVFRVARRVLEVLEERNQDTTEEVMALRESCRVLATRAGLDMPEFLTVQAPVGGGQTDHIKSWLVNVVLPSSPVEGKKTSSSRGRGMKGRGKTPRVTRTTGEEDMEEGRKG